MAKQSKNTAPTNVVAKMYFQGSYEETYKEGYYRLGILATTFAALEEMIHEMLFQLVFNDDSGMYLINDNMLEKNLALLENICNYKKYELEEVEKVVKEIRAVKNDRNTLIHGKWRIYNEVLTNEPLIVVQRPKMKEIKDLSPIKGKKANITSIERRTQNSYTYERLDELITETKRINDVLTSLLLQFGKDRKNGILR